MPSVLSFKDSMQIIADFGINVAPFAQVNTFKDAFTFAEKVGWPVVAKINSPTITHKSDVGGVIKNIYTPKELETAFNKLTNPKNFPGHKINGVYIQKQIIAPYELLVGSKIDKTFGPVLLIGAGGIYTEVLKDISIRLVPISRRDAKEMLLELKYYDLLKGVRGRPPANINAIIDVLCAISKLATKKQILELDINPLLVNDTTAVAVDSRVVL